MHPLKLVEIKNPFGILQPNPNTTGVGWVFFISKNMFWWDTLRSTLLGTLRMSWKEPAPLKTFRSRFGKVGNIAKIVLSVDKRLWTVSLPRYYGPNSKTCHSCLHLFKFPQFIPFHINAGGLGWVWCWPTYHGHAQKCTHKKSFCGLGLFAHASFLPDSHENWFMTDFHQNTMSLCFGDNPS